MNWGKYASEAKDNRKLQTTSLENRLPKMKIVTNGASPKEKPRKRRTKLSALFVKRMEDTIFVEVLSESYYTQISSIEKTKWTGVLVAWMSRLNQSTVSPMQILKAKISLWWKLPSNSRANSLTLSEYLYRKRELHSLQRSQRVWCVPCTHCRLGCLALRVELRNAITQLTWCTSYKLTCPRVQLLTSF